MLTVRLRRRWTLAAAVTVVTSLAVVLVVLAMTAGPVRTGGVEPLVRVETWPPTPAPTEPAQAGLPTSPPPGWQPMPVTPIGPDTVAVPALLADPANSPAQAVSNAYAEGVAAGRFWRVAVALYDRATGTFYGAGDIEVGYRAASVVKTLIAARLLRAGPAGGGSLTSGDWSDLWKMITCSDNNAADRLWWRSGGYQGVIWWVKNTYGISGLSESERPNAWGTTWITARGLALFYNAVAEDPGVAPWLLNAMAHANPNCGNQMWGLPVAASNWAVKQGWVCCWKNPAEPQTRLHSTGYVEGYRYVAVLLTEGPQSLYFGAGRSYVTAMARALLPGGHVPREPGVVVPSRERPAPDVTDKLPEPGQAPPTPVPPPSGRPPATDGPGLP